jgi:hypothetical protein
LIILTIATFHQQQHSATAIPMPMPMPFRRFFFLSAANPTTLMEENANGPVVPQNEPNLAQRFGHGHHLEDGNVDQKQQQSSSSSSNSRAALRGRIPMGPFDQVGTNRPNKFGPIHPNL